MTYLFVTKRASEWNFSQCQQFQAFEKVVQIRILPAKEKNTFVMRREFFNNGRSNSVSANVGHPDQITKVDEGGQKICLFPSILEFPDVGNC